MTESTSGTGPRVPLAALAASALLFALEARLLLRDELAAGPALLLTALDFVGFAALLALALDLVLRIGTGPRAGSGPRRLLLAGLAAASVVTLGLRLGEGAGLGRAGLSWVPPLVLPVMAFGGTLVLLALGRRLPSQRARGLALLGLAGLVRLANGRLFVGLYAAVHDWLFFAELGLAGLGLALLFGPGPAHRARRSPVRTGAVPGARRFPVRTGAALLVASALVVLLVPGLTRGPLVPGETTRAALGREGFHAARFLRWRGARASGERPLDRGLERAIATWQERVRDYEMPAPGEGDWNILWISIDTLRADRCGFIPGSRGREGRSLTPNLDALARRSAVFERAYSPYPSTHLSAEATFTGRYPRGTALYRRLTGQEQDSDAPARRLPALMRAGGLATAATIAFTDVWMSHPAFAEKLQDFDLLNFKRPGGPDLDARHFVVSARETLAALGDRRFFLWFHVFEPHAPYEPHADFAFGRGATDLYEAEVAYADARIGELLAEVERRGLEERTVIVFSSDHGEALGERGIRYHGSALSEVQLRVPIMIAVPGRAATRRRELVSLVDLYPTTLRLAGLEVPPHQGRDLRPLIAGDEELAAEFPAFAYAELPDDVKELSAASSNLAMLRKGDWKLLRHLSEGYGELIDLANDPDEERNLAAAEPERKARLEAELAGMARATRDFGRDLAEASSLLRRRRRALIARFAEEGAGRLGAIEEAAGLDERGWAEVRSHVRDIARDPAADPELRRAALRALVVREDPDARDVRAAFAASADSVLRWAGLLESWSQDPLPDLAAPRDPEPWPIEVERDLLSLAREGTAADRDRTARVRRYARSFSLDPGARRRAVYALALAADPELEAAELLGRNWSLAEARRIIDGLRAREHPLAPVLVERLVRDRYLYPELRRAILEEVPGMPRDRALRIGRHLLAGWDPSFHARAEETYRRRFGAEVTAALARAHQLESECAAVAKKQAWADLPAAYARLVAALPEGDFDDVALDAARADLAAGDLVSAGARVEARFRERGARPDDDVRRARRWRELRAARLAEGELAPEDRIRVGAVRVERGARRRVLPGREFGIEVRVANEADRALPGGPWPGSGRLRVLWFAEGEDKAIYGTETALDRGLLPGEVERRFIRVRAPERPGRYRGRIIVSQHMGARFFRHEEPEDCEFELRVLGPEDLRTPLELEGAELALNLPAPFGVEFWGSREDGSLVAVMTGYEVTMTLGPLRWTAADGVVFDGEVRGAASAPELTAQLLGPIDGVEAKGSIAPSGAASPRLVLPMAVEGGRLALVPGGRAGLLTLRRLRLGPR